MKKTKWIILITFVLLGLAIVLTTSLPNSLQYYVTVDEFFHDLHKYENQEIKIAGKVAPNTIEKNEGGIDWKFTVQNNGVAIPVKYHGAMPDTFKSDADVVVTGKYKDQMFVATDVLAKCASRYEEKLNPKLESKPNA